MIEPTYTDGPTDQPWEVVDEGAEEYSYLYVQRVGRDNDPKRIQTEISFALDRDGEPGLAVARFLAARLNRLDALEAWACAGCGARFPKSAPPAMLKGVTRCSKCVEVQALEQSYSALNSHMQARIERIATLEAALLRLADAVKAKMEDENLNVLETCSCGMCQIGRAEQAAREVLDA